MMRYARRRGASVRLKELQEEARLESQKWRKTQMGVPEYDEDRRKEQKKIQYFETMDLMEEEEYLLSTEQSFHPKRESCSAESG
jgi:hypothetical protein